MTTLTRKRAIKKKSRKKKKKKESIAYAKNETEALRAIETESLALDNKLCDKLQEVLSRVDELMGLLADQGDELRYKIQERLYQIADDESDAEVNPCSHCNQKTVNGG